MESRIGGKKNPFFFPPNNEFVERESWPTIIIVEEKNLWLTYKYGDLEGMYDV